MGILTHCCFTQQRMHCARSCSFHWGPVSCTTTECENSSTAALQCNFLNNSLWGAFSTYFSQFFFFSSKEQVRSCQSLLSASMWTSSVMFFPSSPLSQARCVHFITAYRFSKQSNQIQKYLWFRVKLKKRNKNKKCYVHPRNVPLIKLLARKCMFPLKSKAKYFSHMSMQSWNSLRKANPGVTLALFCFLLAGP